VTDDRSEFLSEPRILDAGTVGVALSGGGVRAALFSAGALFAACEYAHRNGKRLLLSCVSGSSLLAHELAWSGADTDDEALRQVTGRIARKAYWLSRWLWALFLVLMVILVVTLGKHTGHGWDAASILWYLFVFAVGGVELLAFFRSQGIWYSGTKGPAKRGEPTIYSAVPAEYPKHTSRLLHLGAFVFNTTSLNSGERASFPGCDLSPAEKVSRYAMASAAFPGFFLPQQLAGRDNEWFADGGIVDNTGLGYLEELAVAPQRVLVVDAGAHPTGHRSTIPYNFKAPTLKWTLRASATLMLVSAVGIGLGSAWTTIVAAVGFVASLATAVLTVLVAIARGAVSDFRWLQSGLTATVRAASNLRWSAFEAHHINLGGSAARLTLPHHAERKQASTQLWSLKTAVTEEIAVHGYLEAANALGVTPLPATLNFLRDLG